MIGQEATKEVNPLGHVQCHVCGGSWRPHTRMYGEYRGPASICESCSLLLQFWQTYLGALKAGLSVSPILVKIPCPTCGSPVVFETPEEDHLQTHGVCDCHLFWLRSISKRHPDLLGSHGGLYQEVLHPPEQIEPRDDRFVTFPGCPPVRLEDFERWTGQAVYAAAAVTNKQGIRWSAMTPGQLMRSFVAFAEQAHADGDDRLITSTDRDEWVRLLCLLAIQQGTETVQ